METYRFKTPITESDVKALKIGDIVYVDGEIYTARDMAHKRVLEYVKEGKPIPIDFKGAVIYHCGPIMKQEDGCWRALAAGPTTSMRMEMYEADFIRHLKAKVIVGKGGMAAKTAEACREYGAAVCNMTGGAAVVAAKAIKRVKGVEWLEMGMAEAIWTLEVENFGPMTVTIDTSGANLMDEVKQEAVRRKEQLFKELGIKLT